MNGGNIISPLILKHEKIYKMQILYNLGKGFFKKQENWPFELPLYVSVYYDAKLTHAIKEIRKTFANGVRVADLSITNDTAQDCKTHYYAMIVMTV